MSLIFRRSAAPPAEARSFILPGAPASDGYSPNLGRAETSLQSVAVRSAVDLIASLVSELPVDVYRGRGTERTQVSTPGYLLDPGGEGHGLEDWLYQLLVSWLLRGNVYGDAVEWAANGAYPTTIAWHYPDDVNGTDAAGRVAWTVNGRSVDNDRFVHRRVNPVPGRVLGLSPVEFHAAQIGISLTAARYAGSWFRDAATPSGLLRNTETELDAKQADIAKKRYVESMHGSREPLVLGGGWEFTQIQVSPEESQFLETQGFSEAQCARMFGPGVPEVLGYDTGGSMTYANVVDRRADLLVLTLNRWVNRAERLLTWMLPRPQYAKLNRDALLQATTIARYQAHASAINAGWKTANEVRENEDLKPLPGGDDLKPNAAPAAPTPDGGNGNPA